MQLGINFNEETPTARGIRKAVEHADQVTPGWSDQAYEFLLEFVDSFTGGFMAEDVRNEAESKRRVPAPPSARAWGAVILRAAKSGVIRKVGYEKVKNQRAHSTPAAVWRKN